MLTVMQGFMTTADSILASDFFADEEIFFFFIPHVLVFLSELLCQQTDADRMCLGQEIAMADQVAGVQLQICSVWALSVRSN